jgi:hypothetical protein
VVGIAFFFLVGAGIERIEVYWMGDVCTVTMVEIFFICNFCNSNFSPFILDMGDRGQVV